MGTGTAKAGLPSPLSKQIVNGWEVDFYWPDLGLVVETDGLRYHLMPST
jgi:very-short-patch-repair endonuclease